jgi:hypothetical protein
MQFCVVLSRGAFLLQPLSEQKNPAWNTKPRIGSQAVSAAIAEMLKYPFWFI